MDTHDIALGYQANFVVNRVSLPNSTPSTDGRAAMMVRRWLRRNRRCWHDGLGAWE
jgi:hypothetical protein